MKRRSTLLRLLEQVFPDPNPYETAEQFERANHDDIPRLSLEDLDRERILCRLRWALDDHPSDWLLGRMSRLEAEATRRRQEQRVPR